MLQERLDEMSGSGRRRSSKWDLKEDISPENQRANEDGSSFIEHESRDNISGTGDLQRSEGIKEESIPGFEGDGHYATRKSTGLDGGRQQSRTHSSKSRGRSYRRSRSRSRSPARNPRRQPSINDQSSRSEHSAPLCRDFSAGRCKKGDRCHFAHHRNSGRHLDKSDRSDRDDKALQSHSDTYSTGRRSTNICNDVLKGRCRRGASCKFPHHVSGSDEHRKGTVDGSYQDGHGYDHNEQVFTEKKKSPDDWHPKNNLNGMHEVPSDAKWSNRTSPINMPKAHDWDEDIVQADAPGDYNVISYADLSVSSDIPSGQGIHQLNESFSSLPITCVTDVQQSQTTFPLNPTDVGIEMPYHEASEFTQQCDLICDSIETEMDSTRNELMSSSVIPSSSAVPTSVVTGEITISDFVVGFSGDELGNQNLDPDHQGPVNKEVENEGEAGKGTNEAQEQGIEAEMAVNGDINDDKKGKEIKEMRQFKFALAEFVKELLKPAWKEGKMSKEVYKTVVKKVVDKVTDSIQEVHIPGTKEKIDQYLSFSKPKLTKLVQAYLERYKKN